MFSATSQLTTTDVTTLKDKRWLRISVHRSLKCYQLQLTGACPTAQDRPSLSSPSPGPRRAQAQLLRAVCGGGAGGGGPALGAEAGRSPTARDSAGLGRGSCALPPSPGRHLPGLSLPARSSAPARRPQSTREAASQPAPPGDAAPRWGPGRGPPSAGRLRGGAGGGAGAATAAAARRRGPSCSSLSAHRPSRRLRASLGGEGGGQEAACALGSAVAGVGAVGAAEPAPRAAAAGADRSDKGDDYQL
ncbi:translation initiation factor IF-2-like [Elephas maximus indicus]|uniref:translation initiation factor IF-2-like n=1 Tax=Elephas maximus indicus TaxID=99487 RepID=UPI002116B859|nr:translation initiation factor IF-2-like [Elephas maximus indicus]